jgi:hypothetical protein
VDPIANLRACTIPACSTIHHIPVMWNKCAHVLQCCVAIHQIPVKQMCSCVPLLRGRVGPSSPGSSHSDQTGGLLASVL